MASFGLPTSRRQAIDSNAYQYLDTLKLAASKWVLPRGTPPLEAPFPSSTVSPAAKSCRNGRQLRSRWSALPGEHVPRLHDKGAMEVASTLAPASTRRPRPRPRVRGVPLFVREDLKPWFQQIAWLCRWANRWLFGSGGQ